MSHNKSAENLKEVKLVINSKQQIKPINIVNKNSSQSLSNKNELKSISMFNLNKYGSTKTINDADRRTRNVAQVSYSDNNKRNDVNSEFFGNNWVGVGLLNTFNNLWREPKIDWKKASANDNSLLAIIDSFKLKEKKWIEENNQMKSEMLCMKEELSAIREFILDDQSHKNETDKFVKKFQIPIPSFIRACHYDIDNEKSQLFDNQTYNFNYKMPKEVSIKRRQKVLFISNFETPEMEPESERNSSILFNPIHSETKDSSIYK